MVRNNRRHGVFAVERHYDDLTVKPTNEIKNGITIDEALRIVFRQMQLSGNRPRTIESYDFAFTEFIRITGVEYVEDITADTLYDYLNAIDVARATKLVRLKSIKAVLNRFFDNRWIEYRFWTTIQIKIDKQVKKGAKESDVEVLLSLIDRSTFIGFRDTVAVMLLYKTGIRIQTLGELREHHIDFENMLIDLDGAVLKNHDSLKLPINEQIADLLKTLIERNRAIRSKYNTRNNFVFISQNGRGINNTKSSSNAISKQLTKYARNYGLKNINAHALRRAYATNLLNQGANVALISKALGHKSLETTTMYLDLDKETVAENLRSFL